jgi:hypothetical protein
LTLDGERLVDVQESSSDLVGEDFAVEIHEGGEVVEAIKFRHPERLGRWDFLKQEQTMLNDLRRDYTGMLHHLTKFKMYLEKGNLKLFSFYFTKTLGGALIST